MKSLKPMEEIIEGIRCQFVDHGGYYRLQFTDPRSHERQRKSTKTRVPVVAKAFAANLLKGYVPGVSTTKTITVGELVDTMLLAKRNHSEVDYLHCLRTWNLRLKDKFAEWDHRDLTTEVLEEYKSWCLGLPCKRWAPITETVVTVSDDGTSSREVLLNVVSKGTINRDLNVISLAYNAARRSRKIVIELAIPRYGKKELGVRTGEVSVEEFHKVMAEKMPVWLRGILQVSWDAGHRAGEPRNLRVHQFDGEGLQIAPGHGREDAATEKNGNGRWVPLSKAGIELVKQCCAGKQGQDYIFTRDDRNGGNRPVKGFRKMWQTLMTKAIGRIPLQHDFRRSACTNLAEAGVDEKLRMGILGHEDAQTNRKYRQAGRERLIAAMRQKEAWEQQQLSARQEAETDQVAAMQRQLDQANAQNAALLAAIEKLTAGLGIGAVPQIDPKLTHSGNAAKLSN